MLEEEEMTAEENNLFQLRKKVEQVIPKQGFRRKVLGGISEEDVQLFVKDIYDKAQRKEEDYKRQIEELTAYGEILNERLDSDKSELEDLKKSAGYLKYLNTKMEAEIKSLHEDLDQAKSDLENNGKNQSEIAGSYKIEVKRLEKELLQLTREKADMAARVSELEKEINSSRTQLVEYEKRSQLEDYERSTERESAMAKLEEKIAMLGDQLEESHKKLNESYEVNLKLRAQLEENERDTERELAMAKLEEKIAMLGNQLEESHKKLNESYEVNLGLRSQIEEGPIKFDENGQAMIELEQKLKREQLSNARMSEENANLKVRINQLRDETYKQIETLTEQMKVRSAVEDQLSYERIRANNVENNMAELAGMVSNMKGKFQYEQSQLNDELGVLKKKHLESNLGESGCQYIEQVLQQTSQDMENMLISAKNNLNSLLNNASQKLQELSVNYKVFKMDVTGLHSNIEGYQEKTSEWLQTLYTTAEKSHPLDDKRNSLQSNRF